MSWRARPRAALLCGAAALLLAGCGATGPDRTTTTAPSTSTSAAPPSTTIAAAAALASVGHVFVVVMENLGAGPARSVPAFASLAARYESTTRWYAASHPSLPNYLALVSGSTWGITSDCTSCTVRGPNLGTQLTAAGVSWGAYFEGMPAPCFLGSQSPDGSYAQKHDPFAYFDDIRSSPALCGHLQPLSSLPPLLAGPATGVPRFVWVTPSMCHSGHDCSPAVAGSWLEGFVGTVTASAAWRQHGLLVVVWDEGDGTAGVDPATGALRAAGGGGAVLGLVAAPGAPAGRALPVPYDHYSLLATVEDVFGLPRLGAAAGAGVAPLTAFLPPGP
ncbi:MAG: hypothetical protein KGJ77_00650 [Acidobacteriota bacterium]|nr:hypothetical protein [Acidobacteriota bacterium]